MFLFWNSSYWDLWWACFECFKQSFLHGELWFKFDQNNLHLTNSYFDGNLKLMAMFPFFHKKGTIMFWGIVENGKSLPFNFAEIMSKHSEIWFEPGAQICNNIQHVIETGNDAVYSGSCQYDEGGWKNERSLSVDCNKRPLVSSISDLEEGLLKCVGLR